MQGAKKGDAAFQRKGLFPPVLARARGMLVGQKQQRRSKERSRIDHWFEIPSWHLSKTIQSRFGTNVFGATCASMGKQKALTKPW